MTHSDLVEIGYKWLMSRCGVVFKELMAATGTSEIPDVIGFTSGESFLIECKTSRFTELRRMGGLRAGVQKFPSLRRSTVDVE